jgi:biotin synthase-like enzyme
MKSENKKTIKPAQLVKVKCLFCGQIFKPERNVIAEDLVCPECIAQIALDEESIIRCTVCNGWHLPEKPGETTCPECFEDIAQANQPSPINTVKP